MDCPRCDIECRDVERFGNNVYHRCEDCGNYIRPMWLIN